MEAEIFIWFLVAIFGCVVIGFIVAWIAAARMKQKTTIYDWLLFGLPTASVSLVWVLGWALIPITYGSPSDAGMSGDMFGSISSLFSGLAFAGLIATLILQRTELSLQRKELSETRHEFERQRFENRFFSTLSLLNDHIANMRLPSESDNKDLQGGAVLDYFASELPDEITEDLSEVRSIEFQIEQYLALYDVLFEPSLGPYFRLMYNCIRQIDTSSATEIEKESYSKIFRAQLSSSEVKILLFNCATHWGVEFKPWVERYKLLKHLPRDYRLKNPTLASDYVHLKIR